MKDSTLRSQFPTIFRTIWALTQSSKNSVYFLNS